VAAVPIASQTTIKKKFRPDWFKKASTEHVTKIIFIGFLKTADFTSAYTSHKIQA
jgi:hypothetical protein